MLTESQVLLALELYSDRDLDMTIDQIGKAVGVDPSVAQRLVRIDG